MTIEATVVEDSISKAGSRITTMELTYPRFIHSQFLTHRTFSRNSSSSRAIPVAKLLEEVRTNPVIPSHWGKNKSGMQAEQEEVDVEAATKSWLRARDEVIDEVEYLLAIGLHKQVANRLLEPFLHIKTLVTSTSWNNFFIQRLHDSAQPEIQQLAIAMKDALDTSIPVQREVHLPFIFPKEREVYVLPVLKMVSAARCCRISYLKHGANIANVAEDVTRAEQLLKDGHWSPFEHSAQATTSAISAYTNIIGWQSLRYSLENASRTT